MDLKEKEGVGQWEVEWGPTSLSFPTIESVKHNILFVILVNWRRELRKGHPLTIKLGTYTFEYTLRYIDNISLWDWVILNLKKSSTQPYYNISLVYSKMYI